MPCDRLRAAADAVLSILALSPGPPRPTNAGNGAGAPQRGAGRGRGGVTVGGKEVPGAMHGPIIGIGMPDVFAYFAKHTKAR